jgi:hypothetical protein
VAQDRDRLQTLVNGMMNLRVQAPWGWLVGWLMLFRKNIRCLFL